MSPKNRPMTEAYRKTLWAEEILAKPEQKCWRDGKTSWEVAQEVVDECFVAVRIEEMQMRMARGPFYVDANRQLTNQIAEADFSRYCPASVVPKKPIGLSLL